MLSELAIGFLDPELKEKAEVLADKLHLPINPNASLCLWITHAGLGLKKAGFLPVMADFNKKTWTKRTGAGKKQGLIKACHPVFGSYILDVTAGWGRDAAILALSGAEVCMVERSPVMAAILEDALKRQDEVSKKCMKLSLVNMDAYDYLQTLKPASFPDIIYLDPMHPERQKAALVKKDLQLLQILLGEDKDAKTLLDLSLQKAKHKIVVKWPQSKRALLPPDHFIGGKTVRFDVYQTRII